MRDGRKAEGHSKNTGVLCILGLIGRCVGAEGVLRFDIYGALHFDRANGAAFGGC
jgi:hypothetical protein